MGRGAATALTIVLASIAGCAQGHVPTDVGPRDAASTIDAAGAIDATIADAGRRDDAAIDGGLDGRIDAGASDAATTDGGIDAGRDSGPVDAGRDAPPVDAGCPVGLTRCAGLCVDTMISPGHCGMCGMACATGETCTAGTCGPPPATWSTSASDRACTPGARHDYLCPPAGTRGSLWGTGEHTHDSSVCTAAVHAGRITLATGGRITIEMRAGRSSYVGSTRNGITSSSYGSWGCSYAVVAPACPAGSTACGDYCVTDATTDFFACGGCGTTCAAGQSCVAGTCGCPAGQTLCGTTCVDTSTSTAHCGMCSRACGSGETCGGGMCQATWSTNATSHGCPGSIGMRFDYVCPPGGSPGSLWGTDTYTNDSSVCTAAVHVGRITLASGGPITIEVAPGASSYTGSTRNGVTSSSYGSWGCSFIVP